MSQTTRLDLPLLLPGIEDAQDACVARLISMLEDRDGIERVHVAFGPNDDAGSEAAVAKPSGAHQTPALLCLHYDPERVTVAQITETAIASGAALIRRFGHEVIPFRAIGAEDAGARIEATLKALPGVTAATVNFAAQSARVEYDREAVDLAAIRASMAEAGAPAMSEAPQTEPAVRGVAGWYARNQELGWSLIAGICTVAGWLAARNSATSPVSASLFAAAYFFGARDNIGHLVKNLKRGRFRFDIDLLMLVAALGAAILGEWAEGALLLFLFSMGHALQHYALGKARGAIQALAELAPRVATVRRGGADQVIPIDQVRVGDLVVVKPADRISVDGVVREGASAVNQAPITGESVPVEKAASDQVFAGSVNGEGVLVIEVSAAIGDRTLDRVIKLVAEAETQKAPTQQFTDRFERVFVPAVLVADVLVIVVPPLLGIWSWPDSFYRAMALLVAASPCALALGTPAAVLTGIAQAARNGVLIKGGAHLEGLGAIELLALDKTGTITKGEPTVTDLLPGAGVDPLALLSTAAALESQSQHPLARAVVREATKRGQAVGAATDVQSATGHGLRGRFNGVQIEVGRLSLFDAGSPPPPDITEAVRKLEAAGRTTMVVRAAGQTPEWLGVIGVADELRADIPAILGDLRATGVRRIVMLTGDNAGVAAAVAKEAGGIDEVRAGLLPEDKVTAIRELAAGGRVAMVGDGVNDAPALAHATVGIAMGGAGTAAALETADVVLMSDDLSRLPFAVGLSHQARAIIRQNLFISLTVIGILAICTVAGVAGIGPAVIAHEGSTLVVIANALRLLRYRGSARPSGVSDPRDGALRAPEHAG